MRRLERRPIPETYTLRYVARDWKAAALFSLQHGAREEPRIDRISPAQGPIAGGMIVTIRGANFTNAVVKLDRLAVTTLTHSAGEIRLLVFAAFGSLSPLYRKDELT